MPRQETGEPFLRVDSLEANDILNAHPGDYQVIDVRREDEWITGHVQGALHIPLDDLPDRFSELPNGKKLLFICAAGIRSGLACEIASSLGYPTDDLFNIDDGTPFWIENNLPTTYVT